jgi:large subunit ribosomal protein L32e
MAEETEPESEAKVAKKAKKTAVPEAPEPEQALPTAGEIRTAKKAELIRWTERYGLSQEGKVDDLRKRLRSYVEKEAAKAVEKEEEKPTPPKEEKKPAEKPKAKRKPAKKEKAKRGKEEEEEEAEKVHEPRAKPKLEPHMKKLLAFRSAKNAQRPKFRRQEWFRYRTFKDAWRKPQGGQSKLRRHFSYRWNLPSIGYRGPRAVRGLHPSGFREVLVHNEGQLEGLDAATQAVRIAHGVGARKRERIEKACDDKGLRVLNRMVTE